jgi:hypothetical protein
VGVLHDVHAVTHAGRKEGRRSGSEAVCEHGEQFCGSSAENYIVYADRTLSSSSTRAAVAAAAAALTAALRWRQKQ